MQALTHDSFAIAYNLTKEKKTAVSMLCEGNSIRTIERMTGFHRDKALAWASRQAPAATQYGR